jgi:hypothetical protein
MSFFRPIETERNLFGLPFLIEKEDAADIANAAGDIGDDADDPVDADRMDQIDHKSHKRTDQKKGNGVAKKEKTLFALVAYLKLI